MTTGEPKVVLVVEDNRDIAELLAQLLRAYDCEVLTAVRMSAVQEVLARRKVDLLLLDILLPDDVEDGRKIAEQLRREGHKFPIYFMTGLRPPDIGPEYMGLVDGFLRKPFSLRDLREVLVKALGRSAPAGAPSPVRDLMAMMASIASEQEEVRRQQARLATFMTVLRENSARPVSPQVLEEFQERCARCEEGLAHIEKTLNEMQELLRGHGAEILSGQRRGV